MLTLLLIPGAVAALSLQDAVLSAKPAVVLVTARVEAEVTMNCGQGPVIIRPAPFIETGTGWFVDGRGYVITNAHIVDPVHRLPPWVIYELKKKAVEQACVEPALRARRLMRGQRPDIEDQIRRDALDRSLSAAQLTPSPQLTVLLSNGAKLPAEVRKFSPPALLDNNNKPLPDSGRNLALLRVPTGVYPVIGVATRDAQIGDGVSILGFPGFVLSHELLNQSAALEATLTAGNISGFKQDVIGQDLIQTDAPAAHGNSGGPAIGADSKLVGVMTFISLAPLSSGGGSNVQGFNFLIPAKDVLIFLQGTEVTSPGTSEFTPIWVAGLEALSAQRFSVAVARFAEANRLTPNLSDVRRALRQAEDGVRYPPPRPFPWAWITLGTTLLLIAVSSTSAYLLFVKRRKPQPQAIALGDLRERDFQQFHRVKHIHEEKARVDSGQNLSRCFLLQEARLRRLPFFGSCEWQFQPSVNVLLGRNGYGKSLLLRALVALLQRDDDRSGELLREASPDASIELALLCDGDPRLIRRTSLAFDESVGRIPILAIPDSRFLDRSVTVVGAPSAQNIDLKFDGAYHFLRQIPYEEVIQTLLYEMCLDYVEQGRSLDLPVFTFVQDVIHRLTDDSEFRFHSVERTGRSAFEVRVITEGNPQPLPIQNASQGTLSLVALFALIRSYLKSLFPQVPESQLREQPAIVFIDEIDAHLHPKWQQQLPGSLRELFPNVQFVVSAHSPLVVAGCVAGEVAVLRKSPDGFVVEQPDRDFVGARAEDLYRRIFEIEELDHAYLKYSVEASLKHRSPLRARHSERINQLEDKGKLSPLEERELSRLRRESLLIRRVGEVTSERREADDEILELKAEVQRLQSELKQPRPGAKDADR